MTVHEHAQRVLSAGVDGEADSDDVVLATAHVERCADCQRAAGRFAKVVEAAAGLLPDAPPVWLADLPERLPAQVPAPARPAGAQRLRVPRRQAALQPAEPVEELGGLTLVTLLAPDAALQPAPPAAPAGRPATPRRAGAAAMAAKVLSGVTWVAAVAAACLLVVMTAAWVRGRLEADTVVPAATAATDVRMSATVAVRSWVQAVASGNTEGAWSLLSPRARDAVGGRSGFAKRVPQLRARYVALLAEASGSERAVLLEGGDSEVRSVVILAADGQTGPAAAVPVVTAGGTSLVEPFEPAITLSMRRSGRDVVVGVRPAATIRVVIDDGGPVRPAPEPLGAGRAQVTVRAALGKGSHVVVATAIDDEGHIAAKTVVLRVT